MHNPNNINIFAVVLNPGKLTIIQSKIAAGWRVLLPLGHAKIEMINQKYNTNTQ